ncbi:hypothetical protein F5Y15DRAFT_381094 [Xylariaceae sp. FL0016]|nr:hypothetical protein F5Y15DRAFT_381094 [Xylariaceae sp. FL0016]
MVLQQSSLNHRVLGFLITGLVLIFIWRSQPLTSNEAPVTARQPDVAVDMSESIIPKLKIAVRQASSSPPKLTISVTNTHSSPMTVLSWDSPLDPMALQLGLFEFKPAGSDEVIKTPKVMVRRKMPPGPDSLVTIQAGQTEEREVELREPIVPLEKLRGKASVVCKGDWRSVWPVKGEDVSAESLESMGFSDDAFQGSFESQAADMEI